MRPSLHIVLTAVIGIAASIGLFQLSAAWRHQVSVLDFQNRAEAQLSILNNDLHAAGSVLEALRTLYESSGHPIERPEFLHFFDALHGRTADLRETGWAPHVPGNGRDAFEQMMRRSGYPAFQIFARDSQGRAVPSPPRPEYYPITYVASGDKRSDVIGFDVESEPIRRAAAGRAIATGRPAGTPPLATNAVPRERGAMVGFIPVYDAERTGSIEAAEPDGLLFGVFDIPALIENIARTRLGLGGIDMYLFDPLRPANDRLVYWRPDAGREGAAPAEQDLRSLPHWEGTAMMFDQQWGVLFVPTGGAAPLVGAWFAMAPACIGLLLTAMILAYMAVSQRRTRQLEALTRSLRQTTEDLHRQAEKIVDMARHDALTGLPNRRVFAEELEREMARVARGQTDCGVLLIDLDRFKPINDMHGHAVGDAVLSEVAARFRSVMRRQGILARLGGDEFAAIVEYKASEDGPARLADRMVAALNEPIMVDGLALSIGVSIGIALCPAHATDPGVLLRMADAAMYHVKRTGQGSYYFYDPSMEEDLRTRITLQAELAAAIAADEIQPYFQPLVRLDDESIIGVEILARWRHPVRGAVPPDVFIPLAEDAGLIPVMTFNLLRRACKAAAGWPQHWFIALNISPSHLSDRRLPTQLLAILAEASFPPQRLEIEVTEAGVISSAATARAILLAIQAVGIRVALDDFGTGYSSLAHLHQLSFDRIKIDRSFVMSLHDKAESAKIVGAIIGLSKSLAIVTTAEGIEDAATARHLSALGCEVGQGYHYGRPMTAGDLQARFVPRVRQAEPVRVPNSRPPLIPDRLTPAQASPGA